MELSYWCVFQFYAFFGVLSFGASELDYPIIASLLFYPIYLTLIFKFITFLNISDINELIGAVAGYGMIDTVGFINMVTKCGSILFLTIGGYFYYVGSHFG